VQVIDLRCLPLQLELYLVLDPLCEKGLATRLAEQLARHLGQRAVQAELVRM
jgi:hypothetical protein